jgi:hypothetical protein
MDEFSFEDAEVVVHPMLTTPLPGSGAPHPSNSSTSVHPLPQVHYSMALPILLRLE